MIANSQGRRTAASGRRRPTLSLDFYLKILSKSSCAWL